MVDSIVIVGGGLAAARVVRSYREAGGRSALTILSSDTHLPYNRPPLSKGFLRGELEADAVFLEPDDAYAGLEVEVRLGTTVVAVDTLAKRVAVADGAELGYDRLVLASGSLPRPLGVPGEDLDGVHAYRTLDDARAVRDAAGSAERALVVGAGFIGMETAASLRRRGLEVTLIEPADSLYAALQSPAVSDQLARLYGDHGITVLLGDGVAELHGRDGRLAGATTREGRSISADLAIVGVGVQPSTRYLEGTGIERDRGSVVVDERFRTTDPCVYAIGDLARFHDPLTGHRRLIQHWTNASHQGERLGRILAGEDAPYDQVAYFFTEVLGVKLGLLGDLDGGHDRTVTHGDLTDGLIGYYLKDDRLVAALISGQTPETQAELTTLLRDRAHVSELGLPEEAAAWR